MPPSVRALRFRCKACRKGFSITSGTLFAFHKMPLRNYLAATAIFCNEVNGRQVRRVSELAMAAPTSVDWCGYWQRAKKAA